MKPEATRRVATLFAVFALGVGAAQAQEPGWRPFVSLTPAYEG